MSALPKPPKLNKLPSAPLPVGQNPFRTLSQRPSNLLTPQFTKPSPPEPTSAFGRLELYFESIYEWVQETSVQQLLLYFLVLQFVELALYLVLGASAVGTLFWMPFEFFGLMAVASISAFVLAVPSWLFRGELRWKTIFAPVSVSLLIFHLMDNVFVPASQLSLVGPIVKITALFLIYCSGVYHWWSVFRIWTPDNWSSGALKISLLLSFLSAGVVASTAFNRQQFLEDAFGKLPYGVAQKVGGAPLSSSDFTRTLESFGKP